MNYYNEIDPYAAQWLRNLIAAGHIAPGVVDERDIRDVLPVELMAYRQCHFFAGIGVWSYALRLAGWPDDRPVWTGSTPCQPFSTAGRGAGFADQRHLWPALFYLVQQCRPTAIFGEQVASKNADAWIDLVHADVEGLGYAFGACPFPSAGIGAPHVRDRLYWLAVAQGDGERTGLEGHRGYVSHGNQSRRVYTPQVGPTGPTGALSHMADDNGARGPFGLPAQGHGEEGDARVLDDRCNQLAGTSGTLANTSAGEVNGFWSNADWLGCRDGRYRPVEPGTFPLVDGVAARVGRLRAYGNAINAQAAAEFIKASQ